MRNVPALATAALVSTMSLSSMSMGEARAQAPEARLGSDAANLENLRVLAEWWGKGSHFELRGGVWFANLSRGPGSAFAFSETLHHRSRRRHRREEAVEAAALVCAPLLLGEAAKVALVFHALVAIECSRMVGERL